MASKSAQPEAEKADVIEDLLDDVDTSLDRVKVLYEQYFLGIQKQPPSYLHTDVERKLRDLAQLQIRNTALRYRYVTLQQKFGAYHGYWRRTLRQIENGTYVRNLSKIGRLAVRTGEAVPEEILAAMPRRMRDQVIRDREAALALARLRERHAGDAELTQGDDAEFSGEDTDEIEAAFIQEPSELRRNMLTETGAHRIDETDAEFDVDAFFASVIRPDTRPPPFAEARAPRPDSRPPAVSRTATGLPPVVARTATAHPRPASLSGSPDAALMAGAPRMTGSLSGPVASPGAASDGSSPQPVAASSAAQASSPAAARGGAPPNLPAGASANRPPAPGARIDQVVPRLTVGAPPASPAAPSQATMPLRIVPGSLAERAPVTVETLSGPFPRMPLPGAPDVAGPRVSAPLPIGPLATGAAPAVESSGDRRSMAAQPGSPLASGALPAVEASGARQPMSAADVPPARGSAAVVEQSAARVSSAVPIAESVVPAVSPSGAARTAAASEASPASGAPAGHAARALRTPPAGQPTARATPPAGQPSVRMSQPVPPPIPGQRTPAPAVDEPSARMSQPVPPPIPVPRAPTPAVDEPSARTSQAVPPVPGQRAPTPAAGVRMSQPVPPVPRAPTPPAGEPSVRMSQPVPPVPRAPTPPAGEPSARMSQPVPPVPRAPTPAAGEPSARMSQPVPGQRASTSPADEPSGADLSASAAAPSPAAATPRRAPAPRPVSAERPPAESRPKLPPGMTDADVNALYAKYVQAKQILGEEAEPGTYGKLLKTINAQAPRIMNQYKAKAVDFSVVVKDNQVIIRAKPKP